MNKLRAMLSFHISHRDCNNAQTYIDYHTGSILHALFPPLSFLSCHKSPGMRNHSFAGPRLSSYGLLLRGDVWCKERLSIVQRARMRYPTPTWTGWIQSSSSISWTARSTACRRCPGLSLAPPRRALSRLAATRTRFDSAAAGILTSLLNLSAWPTASTTPRLPRTTSRLHWLGGHYYLFRNVYAFDITATGLSLIQYLFSDCGGLSFTVASSSDRSQKWTFLSSYDSTTISFGYWLTDAMLYAVCIALLKEEFRKLEWY